MIPVGASANSLCKPFGVAVDGAGNVYVADSGNSRVLEYDKPLAGGDTVADEVFGQPNGFATAGCNRGGQPGAANLCAPGYVAVDSTGNLYVSDRNNSRVLEYDNPLASDTVADHVLGQFGSFTSGICNNSDNNLRPAVNAGSLCAPAGLALDGSNNLYVADAANSRVLRFATPAGNYRRRRRAGPGAVDHRDRQLRRRAGI